MIQKTQRVNGYSTVLYIWCPGISGAFYFFIYLFIFYYVSTVSRYYLQHEALWVCNGAKVPIFVIHVCHIEANCITINSFSYFVVKLDQVRWKMNKNLCTLLLALSIGIAYSSANTLSRDINAYSFWNPNLSYKHYWSEASNVYKDLSSFKRLYVRYHNCA